MSGKVVLKIDHLSYTYKNGSNALEDVSFEIRENEFVSIIGQNGAGKSTLLKNITGLLKPTSGKIEINGKDTTEMTVARISREIGFVLQNPDRQLFADNVYEEIAYGLRNARLTEEEKAARDAKSTPEELKLREKKRKKRKKGEPHPDARFTEAEIKQRVSETLAAVGLSGMEEEFPPALSKGDRAKVVIASVIAMNPSIIILDEPTSGQDYVGCYQIMNIAKALHAQGHTVVFVTHHMPLVTEFSERTIVMSRKQILMDNLSHEVFSHPEELAKTNIKPPQITQFGKMLSEFVPLNDTMLSVDELGEALLKLQKQA